MNKKSHGEIEEAVVESTVTHRGKELDVIARHINDGTSIYVIFHENGRII